MRTISLEEHTLNYWRISLAYEGRSKQGVSTAEAIEATNAIIKWMNPARPLVKLTLRLGHNIIYGQADAPTAAANTNGAA